VLFDMDGTLYESCIDFTGLRAELGLPCNGLPILAQLEAVPEHERRRGIEQLHALEAKGAEAARPIPGAVELLTWLRTCGVRCGLVTNNTRRSAETVLSRHPLPLDLVLTRDDGPTKPDPALIEEGLRQLSVTRDRAAVVGDTHLDALAAHAAGVTDIYLVHLLPWMAEQIPCNVSYSRAGDLFDVKGQLTDWLDARDTGF
jgi:HAD superfamily hydrolase (TIGR01549 family)